MERKRECGEICPLTDDPKEEERSRGKLLIRKEVQHDGWSLKVSMLSRQGCAVQSIQVKANQKAKCDLPKKLSWASRWISSEGEVTGAEIECPHTGLKIWTIIRKLPRN